jgi:ribosomal protein S12 methylthiotransferase accessory factor
MIKRCTSTCGRSLDQGRKLDVAVTWSGRNPTNVMFSTQRLLGRMLNPMTGLVQMIGFVSHDSNEFRLLTAGAELTGVHVLRDRPRPEVGYYHIGGTGTYTDEVLIRCLGETAERYAHFVSDTFHRQRVRVASYDELTALGETVIAANKLTFFSDQQLDQPQFPYKRFGRHDPIGWIWLQSLVGGHERWVPAQLILVGYLGRPGEQRILSSVTTGSAAHTHPGAALRNALRELIQIDSAMGHWYSSSIAPRIEWDQRVAPIRSLIDLHSPRSLPRPEFYLLQNPDLPGFSVACVVRRPGEVPAAGIGLGMDLRLNRALYAALMEGVGVIQLAKKGLIDRASAGLGTQQIDPYSIYDLDSNVWFYALPENAGLIDTKFAGKESVAARDLPADREVDPWEESRILAGAFRETGKELYWLDLTTPDIYDLGLVVARAWSPDTLSLCMPSAPPSEHHRFRAYGGLTNLLPHPYP